MGGGWGGVGGRFEGWGKQRSGKIGCRSGLGGTQLADRFVSFVCVYALRHGHCILAMLVPLV